ncbi:hypothetical protein AcV7_000619 [Taiwanofungus camphoratus]|nr:hypothetical protein AcV7_000619 [Antrodia cinnamomea]
MSGEAWEAEWERLLWKSKLYPDNYVPQSFLSSLSRNSNFKAYTYWYLVIASCAISQHLATIFTFLAIFVHLNERRLDPRILVWASVGGFVVGFLVWELLDCQSTISRNVNSNRAKTVKSSILVFLALMSLSPVLRTLTAATSSDSIWALSASLFTLNALLADYTALKHGGHHRERLSSVLSMNAAISSSVVLASRLSDDLSVFAVMLFSVQLFALFPMLRRRLQLHHLANIFDPGPLWIFAFLNCFVIEDSDMPLLGFVCLRDVHSTWDPSLGATVQKVRHLSTQGTPRSDPNQWFRCSEIRGTWDPAVPKVKSTEMSAL